MAESYPVEDVATGDGTREVRLRVADTARVVRLVLGLGGRAEVLAPPSVRGEVAAAAAAALDRSGGPGPADGPVGRG